MTQTVLITGASSGIGAELAHCFAREGCRLILVARRGDVLADIAQQLRHDGASDIHCLSLDLTKPEAIDALEHAVQTLGWPVEVLVNNAGFGLLGDVVQLSEAQQHELLQLNIVALTRLTRRLLPGMQQRRHGAILNVASTAAFQPGPGMSVYFASKAYVLSFSEGLAEELRDQGIRVCCLCPGPTATAFGQHSGMENTGIFRHHQLSARAVAEQGHRALRHGQVVVITGWRNRLLATLIRWVPRAWVRRVSGKLLRPNENPG